MVSLRFLSLSAGAEKLRHAGSHNESDDSAPRSLWPPASIRRDALRLLARHRSRLAAGLALLLLSRMCGLALPFAIKRFVDDVAAQGRWELLPWLATAVGATSVVGAGAMFATSQVLGVAAAREVAKAREAIFARVIRWPIAELDRARVGAMLSRVWHDVDGIRSLVGRDAVQLVASTITAGLAFCALLVIDGGLTFAVVSILLLFGVCILVASARMRPLFHERSRILAATTWRLSQAMSGIRTIKAFAAESREDKGFADAVEQLFTNLRQATTGASLISGVSTALLGVSAIAIMIVGGARVRQGMLSVGEVAMFVSFLALLTWPVVQLATLAGPLTEAMASLERLAELHRVATESEEDEAKGVAPSTDNDVASNPLAAVRGEVVLDRVTFAYAPGTAVLRSISLHACPGTTTAIVGSSGAGKSTLVGVIMTLHRPQSGRVLIDGVDLACVARAAYRKHLGVVLQDDFLFDGTLAENIAFSRPDASREDIAWAARLAHCDEFVETWPAGYDTVIGERGVRLSGGQRQRLSIARALLADPRILILDEATSSLDCETEALIQDALETVRRGRTTFVIAHRLSTIVTADQILVIEHGEIVERGRHEALLAREGRYKQLYESQYRGVAADTVAAEVTS